MLTNIYYYNHYSQYATKTSKAKHIQNNNIIWKNFERPPVFKEPAVLLNKAMKNKVISYANGLSRSIVGLKDAAKLFVFDGKYINKSIENYNHEAGLLWLAEDIDNFILAFNSLQKLSISTNHSLDFISFSHNMIDFVNNNKNILDNIGIMFCEHTMSLVFQKKATIDMQELNHAINFFKEAYDKTNNFLNLPLSHHMQFKGLSYYYNYKIGNIEENTFGIIDSGLIVDVAV